MVAILVSFLYDLERQALTMTLRVQVSYEKYGLAGGGVGFV